MQTIGTNGPESTQPTVRASEVGRYLYCARSWWLERVLGYAPLNLAALERGSQRHEQHGRGMALAGHQAALAGWLLLLALALIVLFVFSLTRG